MQVLGRDVMNRLATTYPRPRPDEPKLFATAIGVHLPETTRLVAMVDGDMSTTVHGVSWWEGHPVGDKRRILVGDHLLQSIRSIEMNLVDAQLHRLSLEHCNEVEGRLLRHMVSARRGADGQLRLNMAFPPRANATEDLPRTLGDLHRVGVFRAIGSALDCLGAAIVGIVALPIDLLRADLRRARECISDGRGSIATARDGSNLDHLTSLSRGRSRGSGLGTSPSA